MWGRFEFIEALRKLGLSPKQAAALLGVDLKTVLRWQERKSELPGPAEQALRAWLRLHDLGLPWRPDAALVGLSTEEMAKQIALYREANLQLAEVLDRVQARGGPAAPWKVDLRKCSATLGDTFIIYFYPLPNGGFSPSSYCRDDREPNLERDWPLLEDAIACIAEAVAKAGPKWIGAQP